MNAPTGLAIVALSSTQLQLTWNRGSNLVPSNAVYSSNAYTVAGLTVGHRYLWVKGSGETQFTMNGNVVKQNTPQAVPWNNGTVLFEADDTEIILFGPSSAGAVTGKVYEILVQELYPAVGDGTATCLSTDAEIVTTASPYLNGIYFYPTPGTSNLQIQFVDNGDIHNDSALVTVESPGAGQLELTINIKQGTTRLATVEAAIRRSFPDFFEWFELFSSGVVPKADGQVTSYRIYRNNVLLVEVPGHQTTYTDTVVPGVGYTYKVTAVDEVGEESPYSASVDAPSAEAWAKGFGSGNGDAAWAIATDSNDNIVIAGQFSGTVDFGAGNLASTTTVALFIAKYQPNGHCLWAKRFTVNTTQFSQVGLRAVAVDSDDNIIVTGQFTGTANMGGADLVSVGGLDIVLAKFDPDGNHLWSNSYGHAYADFGLAVAVDSSDNIIIGGQFKEQLRFSASSDYMGQIYGGFFGYVAKFDPDGTFVWQRGTVTRGDCKVNGVAVDSSDNILLTGYFNGSINFGGQDVQAVSLMSFNDIYVAKLDSNGTQVWCNSYGGSYGDAGLALALDAGDNVFIAGVFAWNSDLGAGSVASFGGGRSARSAFLIKLNSSGVHQWSRPSGSLANNDYQPMGSLGGSSPTAIAIGPDDHPVLVGSYSVPVANFGGADLGALGADTGFIAKFNNANGANILSERVGTSGADSPLAVACDSGGNIITTGYFNSTTTIGPSVLASQGFTDIFLYKRGPN